MYNLMLAIHVIAVVAAFIAVGNATMALGRSRRATSAADVVRAARMGSIAAYVNVVLLVIIVLAAAYMVSKKWSWSQGWVSAAFVAVVIAGLLSLIALGPRLTSLGRAAQREGSAPPSREVQLLATHPYAWGAAQIVMLLYVGTLIIMFAKPSGLVSTIILIVAALLGLGATMPARARYRRLSQGSPRLP